MDWMKYRKIYFAISFVVILAGMLGLFTWGLRLGLDFVGGSVVEYRTSKDLDESQVRDKLKELDVDLQSISKTDRTTYILRLPPVSTEKHTDVGNAIKTLDENSEELRFEVVGASFGPELIKKTIYALLIASVVILIWVAVQFKSIKFGTSAVLAMLHDSLVVIGTFALLGHFLGVEVDFLFVTALLTTLSFSVHDTIVVYDRIRETQKKSGGELYELANNAVTETMVRSLNNSFTIVFMLVALVLLGGESIRWFAVALLIGTISGTYSSPFVAVPLLVTWDEIAKKFKK